MSKSKGNVVTPMDLLEKYGSDAVRYWAVSARLGLDATFDEAQIKVGRRLAIKVLNASKFALSMGLPFDADEAALAAAPPPSLEAGAVTEPIDRAVLAALADVVETATTALEGFEHARALETAESLFWTFCDDYIELVKDRANDFDGTHDAAAVRSARTTLAIAVDTFVRLLAPFLPFVTEEVWSWYRTGSVHRAAWPEAAVLREAAGDADAGLVGRAGAVLAALRRVKSEARTSQKTPVLSVALAVAPEVAPAIEAVRADLLEAAKVTGPFTVEVAEAAAEQVDDAAGPESSPVSVTAVELGQAPPRRKRS